jgi:ribosomal protein L37AE/L43A
MFCPICGRALAGPKRGQVVAYPMHICASDGVVYDQRRGAWHGLPEIGDKLCCPACGSAMEGEPKEPPVNIFVCYQCGTTYDKGRKTWYGLAYHAPSAT